MTNPADIPKPLPWDQRGKSIVTLPGGYAGYIDTLREICEHTVKQQPTSQSLATWLQSNYQLTERSAAGRANFLRKTAVLESTSGLLYLTRQASRWHETEDDGILIGLLHSRIQFVGELLAELQDQPRSSEELRQVAKNFGLNWDTKAQVQRRRGWLQSAKLIEPTDRGRLAITDAGRDLLAKLIVHSPDLALEHTRSHPLPKPAPEGKPTSTPKTTILTAPFEQDDPPADREPLPAEVLAKEIREASTDSKNPDRLEIAARDAFQFLGFDAEKLGGSGKTDVLVKAPLVLDDSYSVTVDAKTVGAGSLGDHQVDWVTLDDHRRQHNADYSMLVGPNPSGSRLMNRAIDKSVAVLSTEQLANLCIQHAEAPLGLENYRALFDTGGAVDMARLSRAAQDLTRLRDLAVELCAKLAEKTSAFGPLTASQLMVMLDQPDKPSSVQEIQQVLDTLASPLVGAIQGTADKGYVLATAPRVIQQRLQQLGDLLAAL